MNGPRGRQGGRVEVGAVLTGYAVALVAAGVTTYIRQRLTQGPDAQAAAGMYAFGDAILFAEVFGILALFPSALALYFLRPVGRFWTGLSLTGMALAVTGPIAASVLALSPAAASRRPGWTLTVFFALARVAGAPFLAVAFLAGTVMAPSSRPRWALLASLVVEGTLAMFVVYWLWSQGTA